MSYLDDAAAAIRLALDEDRRETAPPDLLRLYALLVLVKGEGTTPSDVHDAWAVWMQDRDPHHPDIQPFAGLDDNTKQADAPFVVAIRRAARAARGGHTSLN